MNNIITKRYLFNQFEPLVKEIVRGILNITLENKHVVLSKHAMERASQNDVNIDDFIYSLKNNLYRIIEINIKENEVRCLVRTKEKDGYETVASVVLFSGRVCTCWKNELKDEHKTLDMNLYSKEVDVNELMSLFQFNFGLVTNTLVKN